MPREGPGLREATSVVGDRQPYPFPSRTGECQSDWLGMGQGIVQGLLRDAIEVHPHLRIFDADFP